MVGLEDSAAPDTLFLDVTDLGPFFGGEDALAETVVRHFAQRGLEVYVAIADTIGAAWAATHFGIRNAEHGTQHPSGGAISKRPRIGESTSGGLSRFSSDENGTVPLGSATAIPLPVLNRRRQTNEGLSRTRHSSFVIRHSSFLVPLPVEALRLPEETIELLHQLGIYRIGQLELLSRADLASRFGSRLVERWDQATGRLAEPIPALPLPPQLEVEQSLEYPTARQESLELVLEHLLGRLVRMLTCCGRGVVRLRCRLDCQSAGVRELSVGLFEATASARHLFQLVYMQLERLVLPAPVSAIRVEAAITTSLRPRQEELFSDGRQRQRRHSLADLIDRLSSRLGSRSVLRARLIPDAQPERAYSYHPQVDRIPRGGLRGNASRAAESNLPPRPLRLFCRPASLSAVSIVPDGPPLCFCLGSRQHQVAHTWGPERIETGWWRGRTVARDYYRIESATGERFWVFRNLPDGQWFMHGKFA